MKSLILILALVACGDNNAPPPDESAAATKIELTLPGVLDPGHPLPVSWTVDGAQPGDRVQLSLRGPTEELLHPSSAGYHLTGSAPANVSLGKITAAGTITPDPVVTADPAEAGALSLALPSLAEGDWAIDAVILRGDHFAAVDSATTWVSSGGVRLDLSRVWAESGDRVRADIQTRASVEPLRLSAWLTTPDGHTLTLPGLGDQYIPVREGLVADELIGVLDEELGKLGTGRFAISVRLETLDGTERGAAGAFVQICDEPGTLHVAVADEAAAPVTAGTAVAIEVHDRSSVTGTLDATGTTSLVVPAGDWIVVGAGGSSLANVTCGGTTEVEYRGTQPTDAKPTPPAIRFGGNDPDVVKILISSSAPSSNYSTDEYGALTDVAAVKLDQQPHAGITFFTLGEVTRFAETILFKMQLGQDTDVDLDALSIASQFVLSFDVSSRGAAGFTVTATLIEPIEQTIIVRRKIDVANKNETQTRLPELLLALIPSAEVLRAKAVVSQPPRLFANWLNNAPKSGDTVAGQIHVFNDEHPSGIKGVPVTVFITADAGVPITVEGTSDDNGVIAVSYAVPAPDLLPNKVSLRAEHVRANGVVVRSSESVIVPQETASAARLEHPVIAAGGDKTVLSVQIPAAASTRATVTTSPGLTVVGPADSQLDTSGRARVDVASTTTLGPAVVTVTAEPMPEVIVVARARAYVAAPIQLFATVEPTNNMINSSFAEIRGEVRDANGKPLALPVGLQVTGGGDIATTIHSDTSGQFKALYRAPATGTGNVTVTLTVIKSSFVVENVVTLKYGPPCTTCALSVAPTSGTPVKRGATKLFVANRPVTWSANPGSITPEGVFFAPDAGGVAVITAKLISDPSVVVKVAVVEECTFDQLVDNQVTYSGIIQPLSTWLPPYDLSCNLVKLSMQNIGGGDAAVFEHQQNCGSIIGLSGGFGGVSLEGCAIQFTEFAPCGRISQVSWGPDLSTTTTGLTSRAYSSFLANNVCEVQYSARGTLSKP